MSDLGFASVARETEMTTARAVLAGASWSYGSQLVTVVAQFVYAAITARLVGAAGFGEYAIALAVNGLVALLAMGGLGQAASRMIEIDRTRVRALVTYALLLGFAAGAVLFLTAPVWAWLWGVEASASPIRWLALSSCLSPLLGLATGLMARMGKFRGLAMITLGSNLAGMVVGGLAVTTWRSASSLIVSAAVAQMLTLLFALLLGTERHLLGLSALRKGKSEIGFSRRLTGTSTLAYLTGNIVKFSMARGIDGASLGYWNRAEVLTSIPMQQIQSALIRAVYPEFRHDISESSRARVAWTDLLILVAWLALTLSAFAFVLIPPLVPILFGDGWEMASSLAGPLAIAGALQILSTLLASAVEALGRFRWIVSTEVILIGVQIAAATMVIVFHNIWVAVWALVVTNLIRHGWHIFLLGRAGYLDVHRLLRHYSVALCFAAIVGSAVWSGLQFIYLSHISSMFWILAAATVLIPGALCVGLRGKLPAVAIARQYGFFPKDRKDSL